MEPQPTSAVFADAYLSSVHPQTLLVQEVIQLSKRVESATSRAFELNSTDLIALCKVMMHGQLTPTELARGLELSTAAVTTVIDRLEATGHVTRAQHPTDGRGVLVVPTEETVDRAVRTLIPIAQLIDAAIDEFDDDQRAVISRYLTSVAALQRESLQ